MSTPKPEVVATYHGIEVLNGDHLGPQMILNMQDGRYERREVQSALIEVNATDTIIEMGAGAGIVGAIVAKNCKPIKTVSFEANKT